MIVEPDGTLQRSPLDTEHRLLGATMVEFGGWEMPIAYPTGTLEEHLACRNRAVMFDVSHLGTVRVEGPDAFDRLQSTLTNDLGKIEPGPRSTRTCSTPRMPRWSTTSSCGGDPTIPMRST